jgi:hypothetical protein
MRKIFMIDGGAGRVIAAIPALEKYVRNHPNEDVRIVVFGWDNLLWGNKLLQGITYSADTKGIFDLFIKDADVIVTPEPYRVPGYYRQELSLAQAFDNEINNTADHNDLGIPALYLTKAEEKMAANLWADCKDQFKKTKNIVIQPFGRGVRKDRNDIIDDASRSIEPKDYVKIVKKLSTKYNLVLFAEPEFHMPEDTYTLKPSMELRNWISVIEHADYFIGCDSVGQHMARSVGTPGTIILGSTFAINTTYPDYFQILEKKGVEKKYAPIRMGGLDSHLADRYNDRCMEFTDSELNEIVEKIVIDIEKKVK